MCEEKTLKKISCVVVRLVGMKDAVISNLTLLR
jgi:hypothetical protein